LGGGLGVTALAGVGALGAGSGLEGGCVGGAETCMFVPKRSQS